MTTISLLNYRYSTKSGKTMRHWLFKPHTFKHLSTQQPTRACNPTNPAGSWHYPLHLYATFRVADTFGMLLKLMFYQNTYITTIFWWACGLSFGFQAVLSLPHFHFDSENYTNNYAWFLCQITVIKLTGKCAHLFFRHQSTSRLAFDFHHFNSATQWKVTIKTSLMP